MRISGRWLAVTIHAAVVGGLVLLFLVLATMGGKGDANIGLGLAGLPLLALGLPWSVVFCLNPDALADGPLALWLLAVAGPAVVNVGLHALFVRWRTRAGAVPR